MKKLYCLILPLMLVFATETQAKPKLRKFFRKCDKFFSSYVTDGRVDYQRLVDNPSKLDQLTKIISNTSVEDASEKEKKAFYINAYNVLVVSQVVSSYPVESPFSIEGFYDEFFHEVAGEKLSLQNIQEKKLLEQYRDIRISFALCSGTVGSFPLAEYVYKPEKLDKQLTQRVKHLARDERYVRIQRNSSRVLFCEALFQGQKFSEPKDMVKSIAEYLEEEIPEEYALDFYPSDRSLNAYK